MKKINLRIFLAIFLIAVLVVATVFVFWASDAYPADEIALEAMESDSQVFVNAERGVVIFFPADNPRPETGLIFYPGGKVDYRAYAPILKMIASNGYFVALTPAPLNLAMFDFNAAARIEAQYPEIENWFVGGHSLGGVAASSYAASHPNIKGTVLWGSVPADDLLRVNDVPTLSVYGTQDGLISLEMYDNSHDLLPLDATFVVIEGGNHAQFGSYGEQAGDGIAMISPEEQWTQTVDATVEFMKSLSE
ncbi:MAG TPA: alpha/beta hydrolase [Anaerolineae bacterium]|nr:alpha/beta hydrolase [Anaerolineae bacterium]